MFRHTCVALLAPAFLFTLASCDWLFDNDSSSGSSSSSSASDYAVSSATATTSATYTSGTPIEVSASTLTLTVSGAVGGKTLYLAKTNPTSTLIKSTHTRYVERASNTITLNKGSASRAAYDTSAGVAVAHSGCGFIARQARLNKQSLSMGRAARAVTGGYRYRPY